ncbi:MAG: EthD family reductase [Dehalococcoidia bacterium]|jgi:uncharacterized protein (TIGR02118 family)|nr:EthD family reductase [Dehalococcoidia bacterium]MDP6783344.1 EthD family reductase [Dehalococcoidia bacterium]|tara:strand:- start:146 stop:469 length:324 start_codon:yes stop_codon:yes gene_type:complete
MLNLVTLFSLKPGTDIEGFERHYTEVHIPLASKLPGLKKYTRGLVRASANRPSPYYRMAQLYFEDYDSLRRALASPQSQAAVNDTVFFSQVEGLVQFIAEEEELPLP